MMEAGCFSGQVRAHLGHDMATKYSSLKHHLAIELKLSLIFRKSHPWNSHRSI
jgi:hypothetical protein